MERTKTSPRSIGPCTVRSWALSCSTESDTRLTRDTGIGSTRFKAGADANFTRLCGPPDRRLRPLKKTIQPGRKTKTQKTLYQSEESYTAEISQETGYLLLDQKLIHIDDVAGPGMEACDLLDIEGRRF